MLTIASCLDVKTITCIAPMVRKVRSLVAGRWKSVYLYNFHGMVVEYAFRQTPRNPREVASGDVEFME